MAGRALVVALLLLAASAAAAPPTCDAAATATAVTAAQTACGVSDLADLAIGDDFNAGATKFCDSACVAAVAALVETYRFCDDSSARREHERILLEQYECNPPSTTCADKYYDFLFWTKTEEGEACRTAIIQAQAASLGTAQPLYAAVCEGSCGTAISDLLSGMRAAGCAPWAAFVFRQHEFDMFCAKSGTEYCQPSYAASKSQLPDAFDTALPEANRTAILSTVCTNCFVQVQRILERDADFLSRKNPESELCIQDNGRFCLPAVDAVDAAVAANNEGNAINALNRKQCAAAMNRCAKKIWSYRLARTSGADVGRLTIYLRYMCLQNRAGAQCATVMQDVTTRVYLEADSGSGECAADDVAGGCANPPACTLWPTPTVCPFSCSKKLDEEITDFGCCFKTTKTLHTLLDSSSAVLEAFARHEFLSDECCAFQGSGCPIGIRDKLECELLPRVLPPLVLDVPIPFSDVARELSAYTEDVVDDLAESLGLLPEAISIQTITALGTSSTRITFEVSAQNDAQVNAIKTSFLESLEDQDNTLIMRRSSSRYNTRCAPGVNDCNSAMGQRPLQPILMTLLSVLAALLLLW